ncbi:hypothetical protein [Xenorhabdus griffiniae]|uniref:hypothetical protein n=1 Tax=Xenorhabdus griffiniae TaxID=351672 RepID=UPI002359E697|nr:hypothetical protein [Xenorhabdus griffiniae]MDC9607204.1 hypothetical protein [Xenorhabdus griffiniae]
MTTIFHKDKHWEDNPQSYQIYSLLRSKNRSFVYRDEHHFNRKIRRCYPRGNAFIRLERLELNKPHHKDY